jgi:hypothetical protein
MVWLSGVMVSRSISLVSAMIFATFSNVVAKVCSFGGGRQSKRFGAV